MKNNASSVYSFLLVIGDFLALLSAFLLAYVLRFKLLGDGTVATISGRAFAHTMFASLPLWIIAHGFIGLYNQDVYEKRFSELGRLLIGSLLGILTIIGYDFMTSGKLLPGRLVPVYGLALGFGMLLLFRTILRYLRTTLFSYGIGISNVLLVGSSPQTKEIIDVLLDTKHTGYRVLGIVGANRLHDRLPYFTSFKEAITSIDGQLHSIIQTELYADAEKNNEVLDFAHTHHLAYRFVPGNSELFVGNIDVELFQASIPVIAVHQTVLNGWGRIVKRLFDIAVSILILVIAAPLMFVIAILQLLSGGDIFFRQRRLTRFNQEFLVCKFRTVRPAYNGLSPEEAFNKMGQPTLALEYRKNGDQLPRDPRYGWFGNLLRATSLDELPQLFNVLKGDLSLVGPRALVPEELRIYNKKHAILSVKSGLTGLAQVSGRRNISFEERRKLDLYYVQNWSFWLDIVLLLKTVRVVLIGRNLK